MTNIHIEYVDESTVPFWDTNAVIVLLYDGNVIVRENGFGTYNDIQAWGIPKNLTGAMINQILSDVEKLIDEYFIAYNNDVDETMEWLDAKIEQIIDDTYYTDYGMALVLKPSDIMGEWFVNGETPDEIEKYVSQGLVFEDYPVFFPYSPKSYREAAEEYYENFN